MTGVLAMELNIVTDEHRIHRRYNRVQLWRVTLWMVGVDHDGEESRYETDLIPSEPVMATDMVALTVEHYTEMADEYAEIADAGVRLYRLTGGEHADLRRQGDGVKQVDAGYA